MRKNLFFLLAALVAWATIPAVAGAQSGGFYLTPKLGVNYFSSNNILHDGGTDYSYRDGKLRFSGALAIGYDFSDTGAPLRTELEYTIRSAQKTEHNFIDTSRNPFRIGHKLKVDTLMANLYYDFENDTIVTPYIGAGLGLAFVDGKNTYASNWATGLGFGELNGGNSSRKFAWDAAAGLAWDITDNMALDLGYRYFNIHKVQTGRVEGHSPLLSSLGLPSFISNQNFSTESKNVNLHEVMLGLRISYY
ncbi:adhesin [Deltaproteobacteria bacterium]|nr:adhesin [Deltaproteobacteria bacterium]